MDSLNSKLKTQNSKLDRHAWWLSTGRHRPAWQALTAAGVATFTGRPAAHFRAARPGDPVFIYLARPDHAIRAVGVVAKSLSEVQSPKHALERSEGSKIQS